MKTALVIGALFCSAVPFAAQAQLRPVEKDLISVGDNPASCTGPFTGRESGEVRIRRVLTGTSVAIELEDADPNSNFDVDIRCVRKIGSLRTDDEGGGHTRITLSCASLPTTFFIDVAQPPPGGDGHGGYDDTYIAGPFHKADFCLDTID